MRNALIYVNKGIWYLMICDLWVGLTTNYLEFWTLIGTLFLKFWLDHPNVPYLDAEPSIPSVKCLTYESPIAQFRSDKENCFYQ